ncbi:MAG: hypothetical protein JW840_03010 [Candidatus Thermoplasmatota archaeon]|nr:hypothetical protein [Candidatus Thermoplasmatota archaeon]
MGSYTIQVGNQEKHELMYTFGFTGRITAYVDGRQITSFDSPIVGGGESSTKFEIGNKEKHIIEIRAAKGSFFWMNIWVLQDGEIIHKT